MTRTALHLAIATAICLPSIACEDDSAASQTDDASASDEATQAGGADAAAPAIDGTMLAEIAGFAQSPATAPDIDGGEITMTDLGERVVVTMDEVRGLSLVDPDLIISGTITFDDYSHPTSRSSRASLDIEMAWGDTITVIEGFGICTARPDVPNSCHLQEDADVRMDTRAGMYQLDLSEDIWRVELGGTNCVAVYSREGELVDRCG